MKPKFSLITARLGGSKQVTSFLLATFVISWTEQYFIISGDGIQNPVRAFALMWTPGIIGMICSMVFERNLNPLALKLPPARSLALAYLVPILAAIFIVGLLVLFHLADFQVSQKLIEKKGGIGGALFSALVVAPTVGMIVAILSGLGEELGWRGFLHSQLLKLKTNTRYFLTGIIWSLWHWPLIIFGDYATSDHPWINVIFFTIVTVSWSFFMGWLRDTSKSSLPAALAHASHNMWILGIVPAFISAGPLVPYFGGESGFFCALLYLILAGLIFSMSKRNSAGTDGSWHRRC